MRIDGQVKQWWDGYWTNHPEAPLTLHRHWTAETARTVVSYLRDHHQFLIGAAIAIAGALFSGVSLE